MRSQASSLHWIQQFQTLRDQIAALATPAVGPDWEGLSELVAGGLDNATDEELRVIFLEFLSASGVRGEPEALRFDSGFHGFTGGDTEDGSL